MFKNFICAMLIMVISCVSVSAQVIDLSSTRGDIKLKSTIAEVYKPSRLVIGEKAEFLIKGEPGTFVVIVFSGENKGAEPYYGQQLRLGAIVDKIEGIIGDNGIAKLVLEMPESEDLVGASVYFETLVWKEEDLSDISKAKIVGNNGKETGYNAILIGQRSNDGRIPIIGPGVGGVGDLSRTMKAITQKEGSEKNYLYTDDIYYRSKPLMLRNLRAPEVQQKQEINEQ